MSKNRRSTPQRVLVFQGGGSLGAYEAGVFHVLYHWIKSSLSKSETIHCWLKGDLVQVK